MDLQIAVWYWMMSYSWVAQYLRYISKKKFTPAEKEVDVFLQFDD